MSLFSSSILGLPIKLDREFLQRSLSHHWYDTETGHRRSFHLRGPGDGTAGEFHVDLLMWELESQMKKYQEVKRQKLVHSQRQGESNGLPAAGTSVSYEWLRRDAPKSRELEMSTDTRREIRTLCRNTRPNDLDRLRATFAGVLAAREPPPEDVPMIFIEVLKSFSSDNREAKAKVGKFRTALNLLGTLRRLMKLNRIEPEMDTERSQRVLEGNSPCREQLFWARRDHLHCLINMENEAPPSDFALPLNERQTDHDWHKEAEDGDLETQLRVGRVAWQRSKEEVPCGPGPVRKPDYGVNKPMQDMEVIDLVSDSSSEEGILITRGAASPLRV